MQTRLCRLEHDGSGRSGLDRTVSTLRHMLKNNKALQMAVAIPPRRAKKMGQLNKGIAKGYLEQRNRRVVRVRFHRLNVSGERRQPGSEWNIWNSVLAISGRFTGDTFHYSSR